MKRKIVLMSAVMASMAVATPALAGGDHWGGGRPPRPSSSGGGSTSSGGHQVPEPGMLGMMGAALIGLSLVRRRSKSRD